MQTYLMRNIFLGCLLSGFRKTTERENLMLWMCVTSAVNKMQEVLKEIEPFDSLITVRHEHN